MKRRKVLSSMALGAGALSVGACSTQKPVVQVPIVEKTMNKSFSSKKEKLKGNVNHSVAKWCYQNTPIEALAEACQEMGIKSIEIIGEKDWTPLIKNHGLQCALANGSPLGIVTGFNNPDNHEQLLKDNMDIIPKAAALGIPQVICFSGNRNGMDDMVGMDNCAKGLEPVVKLAEKHGINIVMELLNSKVNHKDYMCDHTEWGVALVDKVNSPNFKLLYDIYHMQIMEGDVIATIRKYHEYIGHYHTGGVPGRNEINDTQELYYPAIIKAILDTGFTGYLAQEFIPTREDPMVSLQEGIHICDV